MPLWSLLVVGRLSFVSYKATGKKPEKQDLKKIALFAKLVTFAKKGLEDLRKKRLKRCLFCLRFEFESCDECTGKARGKNLLFLAP